MRYLAFILATCVCVADTTVYLRDASSPEVVQVTNAVDNGDYIRVTAASHGLSVGNKIAVQGVRGCWRANGTRTVAAVPDANTVDLLARDGTTQLDCGGTWINPRGKQDGPGIGQSWLAKLTAYTLKDNPNVQGFDGPAGTFTTGLASRVSTSDPAWSAIKSYADASLSTYTTQAVSGNWPGMLTSFAVVWHALGRDPDSPYLTAAKYLLAKTHQIATAAGCDETQQDCGRYVDIDQCEYDLVGAVEAFSIIADQLTTEEKTAFAQKMLNDKGLNNGSETSCSNPFVWVSGSTITATSGTNTATVSDPSALSVVEVGDRVGWSNGSSLYVGRLVTGKNESTGVITFDGNLTVSASAKAWFYMHTPSDWDSGRCGYVWYEKHHKYNPGFIPTGSATQAEYPYPPWGGYSANEEGNLASWHLRFYMDTGAATCPFDARGCELYEQGQAYFYERVRVWFKNIVSGMTAAGSAWYKIRVDAPIAQIAWGLKSQLSPPIDVTGGNWLKQMLMFSLYQLVPGSSEIQHSYGERNDMMGTGYSRQGDMALAGLYDGTDEAAYWRHWLKNVWSRYTSSANSNGYWGMVRGFLGANYLSTTTDYTAILPTQRIFGHPTDLDESWTGVSLPANGFLGFISKSSWSSAATSIHAAPLGIYTDHSYYPHLGHYQIYRGNWLYGDTEGTTAIGSCTGTAGCFANRDENTSSVEIGAATSATATAYSHVGYNGPFLFDWTAPSNRNYVSVKRWAGDAFAGRSDSAYAYLMFDAAPAANTTYTGTVNYQNYSYLHIKGGGRDYLLRYVNTSLGSSKRMRTYLHFPNNGQSGEGYTSADSSGVIRTTTNASTTMDTTVLLPATLSQTDVHAVRTSASVLTVNANASETYPVRHQNGGASCEYTASGTITVTPGTTSGNVYLWIDTSDCTLHAGHNSSGVTGSGVTIDGSTAAFPGSGAYPVAVWNVAASGWATSAYVRDALPQSAAVAARRYVVDLGTGTDSEYLVLHEPHGDVVSSASAATVTTTTDWQTVQIAHATLPAVAAFSRGSGTKTAWSFTSAHDGTAQYVIAGLAPGSYEVARSGTEIEGSPFTASEGDNTITWTGTAGAYVIGDVPPITLSVDKSSITFSATVSGDDPEAQTVSAICAGGDCTAAVEESCAWLEVSGAGATPATLVFSASITGLSAGVHECSASISAAEATEGSPQIIPITLTITAPQPSTSRYSGRFSGRIK